MTMFRFLFPALLTLALIRPAAAELPSFQALVDATPEGGTLLPAPGVYAGPVVIAKSINVYGSPGVIIDNGGSGTVITLTASRTILSGLTLRNSGDHHTKLDAALHVKSHFNTIKDLTIENCLFGIDLSQANNNIVRRNRIRSVEADVGLKGDAIRVWYSLYNVVEDNVIDDVRDGILVWYSRQNEVRANKVTGSRYGLHFMYAEHNSAERNVFKGNTVGMFSMFANGIVLKNNIILESTGPSGMALGLKQTSDATIEGNTLVGNAVGFFIDTSPESDDVPNTITGNSVAYNGIGMNFHNQQLGNVISGNDFIGNFTPIAVRGGTRTVAGNSWDGNHWDTYQGFDRDRDGVGDSPMELYDYADRLWMDVPAAGFFRGSPVLEMLDFMQRLAPLSQPVMILRDTRPRLRRLAEKPD